MGNILKCFKEVILFISEHNRVINIIGILQSVTALYCNLGGLKNGFKIRIKDAKHVHVVLKNTVVIPKLLLTEVFSRNKIFSATI